MRKKVESAFGISFYPGILVGIATEENRTLVVDENEEVTGTGSDVTAHKLYIPFLSFNFVTVHLFSDSKEELDIIVNGYEGMK